jgi:hypothetical protein
VAAWAADKVAEWAGEDAAGVDRQSLTMKMACLTGLFQFTTPQNYLVSEGHSDHRHAHRQQSQCQIEPDQLAYLAQHLACFFPVLSGDMPA